VFDPTKPTPTGEAAYRFIIDMSEVANDPECLPIDAKDGKCRIAITPEKRVVMYPCRDYSLLNFVCIHKDKYGQPTEGWDSKSSVEAVLSTYSNFSPQILNMLKKASNVKCWQLLQRDLIDSWVKGKVVLIGDAAHPMLPRNIFSSIK
jgi:salicylate hydroxylase